jgi:4-hydroxy-3-methylbut-2-enyl diphosphate reductase
VAWDELTPDDVVVVPAFGTTLELQEKLAERGIDPYRYNTTCPFVEKVWKRSAQLGADRFTVIVHGKDTHEETRATFSHSVRGAPTLVVRDLEEARRLGDIIRGTRDSSEFEAAFRHKCSPGFDPVRDLDRVGVVNQTTMLATETHEIAAELRRALAERHGAESLAEHFADTSDTLCYATNENQNATYALIAHGADLALVVGGYNSSNTSHLVKLCEQSMPAYFVQGAGDLESAASIRHFSLARRAVETTTGWLPSRRPLDIVLTCGASCPDAILDEVLKRLLGFFEGLNPLEEVLSEFIPIAES